MTTFLKSSLASAALVAVAALAVPAQSADLGGHRGGSLKDNGPAYAGPTAGPVSNCYFRADVGYSWSRNPDVNFPVDNTAFNALNGTTFASGNSVSGVSMENGWIGEGGFGCGSGSWGMRAELMLGYHGERKIDGEPIYYAGPAVVGPPAPALVDPLHTTVKTYTAMVNVYKDLGKFGNVTPYVGAGVGVAYNQMSEVYFTGNPALSNRIAGDNDISLAWSLMAGIGYQISDRAILDVGYRYMDLGKISSQRHDNAGNINPRVTVDDMAGHEFKVGLRYHFGASDCCAAQPAYAPMK